MMTENNQKKSAGTGKGTGRGGRRAGSGRKPGTANVKTREIADKAIEEGVTPLEVMLKAMRSFVEAAEKMGTGKIQAVNGEVITQLGLMTEASKIAKDAAPYIHPRLAAIDHTSKGESIGQPGGVLVVPATMSVDDWQKVAEQQNGGGK